jgi:hypothetical protein
LRERWNAAEKRCSEQAEEVKRLREALRKYGWHRPSCPTECDCGLEAALSVEPQRKP